MKGRYEVALDTELELRDYDEFPPFAQLTDLSKQQDPMVIEFHGRRLVWHPGSGEHLPVTTIMFDDDSNYEPDRLLVERFLSVLSYKFQAGVRVKTTAASSLKTELDPPLLRQPLPRPAVYPAPGALTRTSDDKDLALALAHMREGTSSVSPAHRYFSYWKAIEVTTGKKAFATWVGTEAARLSDADDTRSASEHFKHLNETRIAAAHANPSGDEVLRHDPDHPQPVQRFNQDSALLFRLARAAIEERWPRPVATTHRAPS